MIKNTLLITACSLLFFACTQERTPCLTPKIASFNVECVHFLSDTATIPVDTALPNAVFCPITTNGEYIIFGQQAIFTLSLSPDADSCAYMFTTDSLLYPKDTLKFYYKRQLQFLSNACGYAYFYYFDSAYTTKYNIDSAHIITNSVTNNVKPTHFKIYIHKNY